MTNAARRILTVSLIVLAVVLGAAVPSRARSHGGGHGFRGGHFSGRFAAHHAFERSGEEHRGARGRVFLGVEPWWPYDPFWDWDFPPDYVHSPPPVVSSPPPVYVERPPAGYWYYCGSAHAYYPKVQACPEPWVQVAPRPG